jgi:hypothetical protein
MTHCTELGLITSIDSCDRVMGTVRKSGSQEIGKLRPIAKNMGRITTGRDDGRYDRGDSQLQQADEIAG